MQQQIRDEKIVQTLVDLLTDRATGRHAQRGYTFFGGDGLDDRWLRYVELHRAAQDVASVLSATPSVARWMGSAPNRETIRSLDLPSASRSAPRVVILCPPGPSYLTALFGTFCAGLVAVTAYPPRANRRDFRLDCVISDSSASIALVDSTIMRRRDQILRATPNLAELVWIDVEDLSYPTTSQWTAPNCLPIHSRCCNTLRDRQASPKVFV